MSVGVVVLLEKIDIHNQKTDHLVVAFGLVDDLREDGIKIASVVDIGESIGDGEFFDDFTVGNIVGDGDVTDFLIVDVKYPRDGNIDPVGLIGFGTVLKLTSPRVVVLNGFPKLCVGSITRLMARHMAVSIPQKLLFGVATHFAKFLALEFLDLNLQL